MNKVDKELGSGKDDRNPPGKDDANTDTKETVNSQEEEVLIDTSKMSKDEREAMEMAEVAREKESKFSSFMKKLFMGTFDPKFFFPLPKQSPQEKLIGDEICQKVNDFLKKNLDPDEVDETRRIPDTVIRGLAEMGLFGMKIPKKYGGMGLSIVNYNRVITVVSSYCGSTSVLLSAHQSIGVSEPLKQFGTDSQKEKYLPRIAKGAISGLALTEKDVGSDPAQMKAHAYLSEDKKYYILNGEKLWCTNGPVAELLIVIAQTSPKIVNGKERKQATAFILETDTPGLEVLHRCDFMGIRGINNGVLKFTDVKIPVENLLWRPGRGMALVLRTLNSGRLTLASSCAGTAKQCLSIVRRWGKDRVQWGQPIGKHEAGSNKIAFISATAFAIESIGWINCHWTDIAQMDLRIETAIGKYFCSEMLLKIVHETLQLRGGRGYEKTASLLARGEEGYPVERILRDSRILTIIEGTSEIMQLSIAREALDPHLSMIAPLMKKGIPFSDVMKTVGQVLKFYGVWYPKQMFGGLRTHSYSEMEELSPHFCYVEKTAHTLARKFFNQMARYQQDFAKKQVLLGYFIDIAADLFAITTSCCYAKSLMDQGRNQENPQPQADYFCLLAKRRIKSNFYAIDHYNTKMGNALAEQVLDGSMKWQEKGIITIGSEDK